jgi:thioredoxin reductase (NADPH)
VERQDREAVTVDPLISPPGSERLHVTAPKGLIETDAVIVGAGPVGLFQVFQLGLLEVKAHVIDTLPYAGGQCAELYPDKPIYDIPAIAVCTGRELTDRLLQQIAPFGATFHYSQQVTAVQKQPDGRFAVDTSQGTRFLTKTVFIAAGVGAFLPRTLKIDGLERFEGSQLNYRVTNTSDYADKNLIIVGGDDIALDWALQLCAAHQDGNPHKARSVTLLHRRDVLQGDPFTVATMRALCDAQHMQFKVGQITGFEEVNGLLTGARVAGVDGVEKMIPADALLVLLGLSPKLGSIADWGLDMERKQLQVDTETFSTSTPGIFAVGDINTYPGKKKLIVCGFHECVLAAYGAMPFIAPDKRVLLQYTTTSPRLHKMLGVGSTARD